MPLLPFRLETRSHYRESLNSPGDIFGAHVQMRDGAQKIPSEGVNQDTMFFQPHPYFLLVQTRSGGIDHEDVGLYRLEIDVQTVHGVHALGKMSRVRVVFGQTINVVLKSMESRGSQNAGLPHGAAEPFPDPQRLIDEIPRTDQHRAYRRAEPL